MKKIFLLLILFVPFVVRAETLPPEVNDCLENVDADYIAAPFAYKEYVARYRSCYIDHGAENLMPANLTYELSDENAKAADCQIRAGEKYNKSISECLSVFQNDLVNGMITLDEFNENYPSCYEGKILSEYKIDISNCYEEADFGWVWEIPELKESLTNVYDDFQNISADQGRKLNSCLAEVERHNDLSVPSSKVQNEVAGCFYNAGFDSFGDLYTKTAITIDCAKESLNVEDLNDARFLITSATEKQKAYMEQCILEKTVPVVTGIAFINIPFAVGGIQSAVYLQFLFFQILYIFRKRRGVSQGLVYDSFSKKPIDLAIIRLIDRAKDKVIRTFVTGRSGKYMFLPKAGEYKLEVNKQQFDFPSKLIEPSKDNYFGEILEIVTSSDIIAENIPLDPKVKEKKTWLWNWQRRKEKFAFSIAFLAPIYSLGSLIFVQKLWLIALAIVNIIFLLVFIRLKKRKEKNRFGRILDSNGKAVKNVVVSIFETKFKKKLAYTVTDIWGRYYLPTVAGEYIISAEKQKYKYYEEKINVSEKDVEEGKVNMEIVLLSE